LKPEGWGLPLVQEKYQEEKACDKRHPYRIIIIIIIIITSKQLRQYLSNIPGKQEIKELQQIAILVSAHILRKVLM